MMDPVRFVRSLELKERPTYPLPSCRYIYVPRNAKSDGLVVAGSITSFTSQLKGQQKEDVLNSTLLSQLAADKKHHRDEDPKNWYRFYANVMGHLGWVIQEFSFNEYKSSQSEFKISDVVLKLLSGLIGGDKEMMKVVKDTLDSLAKSEDGLTLFSSKSASGKYGNFQIVPCTLDKSNQVNVAFIGFYFQACAVSHNYFFATMKKQDISLSKTAEVVTLNEDQYGRVREEVKKKLGDRAKHFIVNLDI